MPGLPAGTSATIARGGAAAFAAAVCLTAVLASLAGAAPSDASGGAASAAPYSVGQTADTHAMAPAETTGSAAPRPTYAGRGGARAASSALVDPLVRSELASDDQAPVAVIVRLADRGGAQGMDPGDAGPPPAATLRRSYEARAAGVMGVLERARGEGQATRITPLWIANAVAVTTTPAVIRELAVRPDVRIITLDRPLRLEPWRPPERISASATSAAGPEWNIREIRADDAWHVMGVDGTGTTVAVLDTGVDVHHGSLITRYRGYLTTGLRNQGNWWCNAEDPLCGFANAYPADSIGHGTHVTGSAVGGEGIGVAPGARWMAARVCANSSCELSWIVSALQWLLAPGGRPELRPDVVNLSFGSEQEDQVLVLKESVDALVAAGSVVVASSGNQPSFVTVPGTYPSAITVGAVAQGGALWPLSGSGENAWKERKPEVVAPGVAITSAIPGGGLALNTGTSMAAPHVSGVAALLRQARPELTPAEIKSVLVRTATPTGSQHPDPAAGWGIVNAYAAVAAVTDVGSIRGVVARLDGEPIAWARLHLSEPDGAHLATTSVGTDGAYEFAVRPGSYAVTAEAFSFQSETRRPVEVGEGQVTTVDFSLAAQPAMGILAGWVYGRKGDLRVPIEAEVELADAPPEFSIRSNPHTGFSAQLPAGTYDVRVAESGYRVLTDTVTIAAGQLVTRTYDLRPAPRILLVDGDAWLYRNAIDSFRRSLDRVGYVYDEWPVVDDSAGAGGDGGPPTASDMKRYDVVIWSSNASSPGTVYAGEEIDRYLAAGGRLFLTGQDALCLDAGSDLGSDACNQRPNHEPYVQARLHARVVRDNAGDSVIVGAPDGPLAGLRLTLNGASSLDNQIAPDVLDVTDPLASSVIAGYERGGGAAILAGPCLAHRAIAFGFGFEGIAGAAARDLVMDRVIQALWSPAPPTRLKLHAPISRGIADVSRTHDYTVTLRNEGATAADVAVALEGNKWESALWEPGFGKPLPGPIAVGSCQQALVGVRVRVPAEALRGEIDRVTVTATARGSGIIAREVLSTSRIAPLLLVDGDFFTDSEQRYKDALVAAGVPYDTWELGLLNNPPDVPAYADLAPYPAVVWFTGYDWRPDGSLNLDGQRALARYLDSGGRLLFASEDYLLVRSSTPYTGTHYFHSDYLGVRGYAIDEGQAHQGPMHGGPGSAFDGLSACRLPERTLDNDLSDALVPRPEARGAMADVAGQWVAVESASSAFRSLFLAFDAGLLEPDCADEVMRRAIDWFSPLHGSALRVADGRATVAGGDTVSLEITLRNESPRSAPGVSVHWSLPPSTTLVALPPGWEADASGALRWSGALASGEWRTDAATVRLADAMPAHSLLASTATITDSSGLRLRREVVLRVNAPDLSRSQKTVADAQRIVDVGDSATFSLVLRNSGTHPAQAVVVTDTLPTGLALVPGSIHVDSGTVASDASTRTIVWRTSVAAGRLAALSYDARVATYAGGPQLNRAVLTDEFGDVHVLTAEVRARPRLFLPFLLRRPSTAP